MQQIAALLFLSLCVASCAFPEDDETSLIQSSPTTARVRRDVESEAGFTRSMLLKLHLAFTQRSAETYNDDIGSGGKQHIHGLLVVICFVIPTVFGGFLIWHKLFVTTPTDVADPEVSPGQKKKSQMKRKLHHNSKAGAWRRQLGKLLESNIVAIIIVLLVLVDIATSVLGDLLEYTDIFNPKYEERWELTSILMEKISLVVLIIFMVEQILLLYAFRMDFFGHFFYVMDVVVVYISFLSEAVLGPLFEAFAGWLIALRLWKVVALICDMVDLIEA